MSDKKTFRARWQAFSRASLAQCFKQFRLGAMLFFAGLVVVYVAAQTLSPSLQQELVTLGGLIVVGIGFAISMLAQIRMLCARLVRFWQNR